MTPEIDPWFAIFNLMFIVALAVLCVECYKVGKRDGIEEGKRKE